MLSSNIPKRARLSPENDLPHVSDQADPHFEMSLRRNRTSLPVRIVHRLTNRDESGPYDPNTISLQTKRQQRKIEKQQRRLQEKIERHRREDVEDLQNRCNFDQISRQLEANERERLTRLADSPVRRSVREKVKNTLRKTTKIRRAKTQASPASAHPLDAPKYIPPADSYEEKSHFRPPYDPTDFETPHLPAQTISELPSAAELPAVSISPPYDFKSDAGKRHSDDSIDLDTIPPPIRSPSPCLSSIPRRGITLSQTPPVLSNKQMQCDYCHDALRLAGFHYACVVCDDGDRLYCAKCTNEGRTCRHELIERTRNIQRHPTNPQPFTHHHHERKNYSLGNDSVVSADAHAELSAASPLPENTVVNTGNHHSSEPSAPAEPTTLPDASPTSLNSPTEVFKEFETKRREQDVIFREKEVTLREREASLREREAWTASRERDAAFVQQLHAAAMFQRERATEVGAQFVQTPSRHPSYSSNMSYMQTERPDTAAGRPSLVCSHASYVRTDSPESESICPSRSCSSSMGGRTPGMRSHANSSKRKASGPETKSCSKTSQKTQPGARRTPPNKNNRRHEDQDDSDDSEGGSPKRRKQATVDPQNRLFACPYFKFEPLRYAEGNTHELHYRGCAGGLFRDISRVKQHLKRVHHRPDFYCRRCFTVFGTSEELQEHSSQREGCAAEVCPFPEKLDETQQNKIHVKRPGKDPKELWYDIFKIIFPGVPLPDSPYIEAAQPKSSEQSILEHFVRLFEAKLDSSISSQSWLSSVTARDFLRAQMRQTVQETILQASNQPSRVPSVLVSPISPTDGSQFPESRQGSQSSRASSSVDSADIVHSNYRPLLSPVSPMKPLRPALKVRTQTASSNSESPLYSARSQSSSRFPAVLPHVQDDLERQNVAGSWQSGDDIFAMTASLDVSGRPPINPDSLSDTRDGMQEPASATSTRSGKSVSFVTPPPWVTSWRETHEPPATWGIAYPRDVMQPDLSYFTTLDWSAEAFAGSNDYGQQATSGKQRSHPTDSAYGTLSSQPSRSSMFPPTPQSFNSIRRPSISYDLPEKLTEQNTAPQFTHLDQNQHSNCVDPQVLYVNPVDANLYMPGITPDCQAYLNRNTSKLGRP